MKVAVVGSGIAGMVVARRLFDAGHDVTVHEARNRIGGHTATRNVSVEGRRYVVDGAFVAFNDVGYPRFCALLDELGIRRRAADLSFGARALNGDVEYGGAQLGTFFAQRSNLARPRFWRLLREIQRFHARDAWTRGGGTATTLQDAARDLGLTPDLVDWYLIPLATAKWSCAAADARRLPASALERLAAQHGIVGAPARCNWFSVEGGSRTYARALLGPLSHRVRLASTVKRVKAKGVGEVTVKTDNGTERYDRVVLACHPDQALRVLGKPSEAESSVLGAFRYEANDVTLHCDPALMPARRTSWSSWNVRIEEDDEEAPAQVTYWMNQIQAIDGPDDLFVTLNGDEQIDPARVLKAKTFYHPVLDESARAAQGRFDEIDGIRGVHYCGAYWADGFHEGGVESAERVVQKLTTHAFVLG